MKKQTRQSVLAIIFGGVFLAIATLLPYVPQPMRKINLEASQVPQLPNVSFYLPIISPETYHPSEGFVHEAFVRTSPVSWSYPIAYMFEIEDEKNEIYPNLYLADKRIQEFMRWGNDLTLLMPTEATNAAMFASWWESNTPTPRHISSLRILNSYESILSRFNRLVQKDIDEISKLNKAKDRIERMGYMREFINERFNRISKAINESNFDSSQKMYMNQTARTVFAALRTQTDSEEYLLTPGVQSVSLEDIHSSSQYGTYKITAKKNLEDVKIAINGSELANLLIPINPETANLTISTPTPELLPDVVCEQPSQFELDPAIKQYLLTITYPVGNAIRYRISDRGGAHTMVEKTLTQGRSLAPWRDIITVPDKATGPFVFAIVPDGEEICNQPDLSVSLKPIQQFDITLTKHTSETYTIPNATKTVPAWGKALPAIRAVLYIGGIVLWYFARFIILKLIKLVIKHIMKYRFFIAAITGLGLAADLFFIRQSSEIIIAILYPSFLITAATYGIGLFAQTFTAAIMFFVVPCAYIAGYPQIAEKFGIWGFLLILTSFFGLILGAPWNTDSEIGTRLINDALVFIRYSQVKQYIYQIKNTTQKEIILYYGFNNDKKPNPAAITIKTILLILALICAGYISKELYKETSYQYEVFKMRRLYNTRKPKITLIEPAIVYPGTTVLIKGSEFEWKQNAPVKLMSNNGEIATSFWGDQKIIFTIPLDWKPGILSVWVEKPMIFEGRRQIIKSEPAQIELIPVSESFTDKDDAFYEQIDKLDEETIKLNGFKR